jgi:hypothetical protein
MEKISKIELARLIRNCISLYKKILPEEYALALESVKKSRAEQSNNGKFLAKKDIDLLERKLYSIPEKLLMLLINNLNDEENAWITTEKGGVWFAQTFPEWSIVEKAKI